MPTPRRSLLGLSRSHEAAPLAHRGALGGGGVLARCIIARDRSVSSGSLWERSPRRRRERVQSGTGARAGRADASDRAAAESRRDGSPPQMRPWPRRFLAPRSPSPLRLVRRAERSSRRLALAVYVLVYTPMKRRSSWSTLPGAVSGAMPTLMGYPPRQARSAARLVSFRHPLFLAVPAHLGHRRHLSRGLRARWESRSSGPRGSRPGRWSPRWRSSFTSLLPSLLGRRRAPLHRGCARFWVWRFWYPRFVSETAPAGRARTALLAASLVYLPLILALVALGAWSAERSL